MKSGFKRFLKVALFLAIGLVTLCGLLIAVENFTGRRAWDKCRREMESRGISLDPASYIPPRVPEDQNFASTPLLARLFDSGNTNDVPAEKIKGLIPVLLNPAEGTVKQLRGPDLLGYPGGREVDVLAWQECLGTTNLLWFLEDARQEMGDISAASRRPFARFPIAYEKGAGMLFPHLSILRQLGRLYLLRTVANLRQGNTDAAFEDVNTLFLLAQSVKDEPLLTSHLLRLAMLGFYLQGVWEGLATHQWSPVQMQVIQKQALQNDLLAELEHAINGELVLFCNKTGFDMMTDRRLVAGDMMPGAFVARMLPSGFFYHNMANMDRLRLTLCVAIDVPDHAVNPGVAPSLDDLLTMGLPRRCHYMLAGMLLPSIDALACRSAAAQTSMDQAAVACALDQYRSDKGTYPDSPDLLVPEYMVRVPRDVIARQPMKYRPLGQDGYVLYSVGWNQKDDNGKIALKPDGSTLTLSQRRDFKRGDWVWFSTPVTAPPTVSE